MKNKFIFLASLFVLAWTLFADDKKVEVINFKLENNILSNDFQVASKALDENVKENDLKSICVSLRSPFFQIRVRAAKSLQKHNLSALVNELITAYENNQVEYTGGSEIEVMQKELDDEVFKTLEIFTGIPRKAKDSDSILSYKDWLNKNSPKKE